MKTNLLLLIVLIVLLISFLLFSDKGNTLAKPQLENFINNELLHNGEHVDVKNFTLDLNKINASLLYNKTSTIDIEGNYSLLLQNFDINYKLTLKDFKYKNIELKEPLNAAGHAVGSYSLVDNKFRMAYDVNIDDLTKLQPITKQKLYGSIFLRGEVRQEDNKTTITGKTEDLGGELEFKLYNQQFNLHMDRLSVEKIMAMLHYPSVFKASVIGEGNYNLSEEKGAFASTLLDAELLPNDFIELVKNFNGLDLTKEKFKDSNLSGTIEKEHVDFDFIAKNNKTLIKLSPASIEIDKNIIDAHYNIEVKDKDVGGKIVGNISNPEISIDSSKYIQKELNKAIEKHKEQLKELGIGEKEQKKVKEFLNNLFD